jgi:uncharacterized protein (AIM24 family)
VPLGKPRFLEGLTALRLAGRGTVVLAAGEGLASIPLKQGTPLYVRPSSVVAWTGTADPAVDRGEDFKKVKGCFEGPFLRFEGSGRVLLNGGNII